MTEIVSGCLNKAVDNSAEVPRGEGESPTPQSNLKTTHQSISPVSESVPKGALSCINIFNLLFYYTYMEGKWHDEI
ncbi:hypothetical protein ES708_20882 [subsurface metagenome]